jgi:hypothetical protein
MYTRSHRLGQPMKTLAFPKKVRCVDGAERK